VATTFPDMADDFQVTVDSADPHAQADPEGNEFCVG
jgi:hypothetical protein